MVDIISTDDYSTNNCRLMIVELIMAGSYRWFIMVDVDS